MFKEVLLYISSIYLNTATVYSILKTPFLLEKKAYLGKKQFEV